MQPQDTSRVLSRIAETSHGRIVDVVGPIVEFLTPLGNDDDFCVLKGTIPPGVVVPLHSHPDTESFLVLVGTQQVLIRSADRAEWHEVHAGDYVHVQPGTPHAWRNDTEDPVIDLMITTPRLARFFQEAGKPIHAAPEPPTPDDLERLAAVAARYGYWLGSPEENAAVGIELLAPLAANR
ncbi:MAG: cupin domain-containing protein [Solirubrobacteraceae bacterium]